MQESSRFVSAAFWWWALIYSVKWVTFWKVLTSQKCSEKFSTSHTDEKLQQDFWKLMGTGRFWVFFQTSELICLVLCNSLSLLTGWVKQNLAEISTTYLSEMKLKVIFGNSLQSDIFPHMSWCKDWNILDLCMRGKRKCMWRAQWRGVTIVLDSSMLMIQFFL